MVPPELLEVATGACPSLESKKSNILMGAFKALDLYHPADVKEAKHQPPLRATDCGDRRGAQPSPSMGRMPSPENPDDDDDKAYFRAEQAPEREGSVAFKRFWAALATLLPIKRRKVNPDKCIDLRKQITDKIL
jgi:hypothetical protein